MKKSIFSLVLVLLMCAGVVFSQKPCDLTLKDSLTVRGLRVGMTESEIAKIFGKNKIDEIITHSGVPKMDDGSFMRAYLSSALEPYKVFEGVNSLTLFTFNGKLIELEAGYKDEYLDFSDAEFKQKLSDILKVSLQNWKGDFLTCKDFQVYAKRPKLRIVDYYFLMEAIKKIQDEKKIFVP